MATNCPPEVNAQTAARLLQAIARRDKPEQWRPVVGKEGLYEVSDAGNVRSLDRIVTRSDGSQERRRGVLLRLNKMGNDGRYRSVTVAGRVVGVHRLVYEAFVGPIPAGHQIDHRDLDRSNNCPSNLRPATRSQNHANRRAPITNTSGFKGVTLVKDKRLWMAWIKVNQKGIFLGYFRSPEQASEAYRAAAVQYFGEFGRA